MIGQMLVVLEMHQIPDVKIMGSTLGELHREAQRLGLRSVVRQLDRVKEHFSAAGTTTTTMRAMIVDVYNRMLESLEDSFFLSVPVENVPLYRSTEPLFGTDVAAKFPEMNEDIDEAGKCLALNRSTAAVFHLMRIIEIGVRRFGDRLGIELTTEKNWQPILDEINKAIKGMDHKLPQTKAYAATSSHLYNVKIAWRNEVMHPKQTYTEKEARAVFSSVDTFIRDLTSMFEKQGHRS
jgi:hypothetical protein